MSNVPEGAQRSEDGHYWWDGSQWQPVEGEEGGQHGGSGGSGGGSEALVNAFAQQGISVDASAIGDPQQVSAVINHLNQWYSQLDSTSRTIVDSLSQQGLTHLLADPEVAVVDESASQLLYAMASTGQSMEQQLVASNQAIQQAGGGGDNTAYA